MTLTPERLLAAGFKIIPVVPPGAPLAPSSTLAPSSLGKSPGVKLANGLWCGVAWRALDATVEDAKRWASWGANIGVRADTTPALDIDVADEPLAEMIATAALARLGATPVRVGSPPKRLLPYRAREPFTRMRLLIKRGETQYLVEWLGAGQQWLAAGTHPTGRAYSWSDDPTTATLPDVTREQAEAFLSELSGVLTMLGYECSMTGDGRVVTKTRAADQQRLEAPSMAELRTAVALIPNPADYGWDDFVRVMYAIKAASGAEEEDGCEVFLEWASRWPLHGARNDGFNPGETRALWRRTHGPYSIGWSWIAELARQYGYNDAPFETDAEPATAPTPAENRHRAAPFLSDQWLAGRVVDAARGVLRYVPKKELWLCWDRTRWQPDAELLAEDTIKLELRGIAHWLQDHWGASDADKAKAEREAARICSAGTHSAVARLVKMDRSISVSPELLDFNPWILNTPGGVVDLQTGRMIPPDPNELCTRSTSVAPDFDGTAPLWHRFLAETTAGDAALQGYLKRLAGYCCTGSTKEQMYAFIHGEGGNGKGTFLNALMGILATYHRDSPMETFVASNNDRHPTELAHLAGARFVTASETDAGRRWDEPRLKRMTGGDPITARGMREDFFTYTPQFKLVFIGNHKPVIRNLDEAMRRRTHLVPFVHTPKARDNDLGEKLRAEWPAILAWMIEGCLEWQRDGLCPPESVLEATEEYFTESDTLGQWIMDCCAPADAETFTELAPLYQSWREWCGRNGLQYAGSPQTFSSKLATRYQKRRGPISRRAEFAGIVLNSADPLKGLVAE